MKQSRVSIRYAKALLALAEEEGVLEKTHEDMCFIKSVCSQNKDFMLMLKSPIIKTDLKIKIFKEIFSDNLTRVSRGFVNIITEKRRENLLNSIANSFIRIYKESKNIETATVKTAIPLDKQLKEEVIKFVQKGGNQNVELTEVVDRSLLGGIVITSGGKQLDASVSSAIYELKQKFNKNLYLQDY